MEGRRGTTTVNVFDDVFQGHVVLRVWNSWDFKGRNGNKVNYTISKWTKTLSSFSEASWTPSKYYEYKFAKDDVHQSLYFVDSFFFLVSSRLQQLVLSARNDGTNCKTVLFMLQHGMIRSTRSNCNEFWCRSEQSEFCHFLKIKFVEKWSLTLVCRQGEVFPP